MARWHDGISFELSVHGPFQYWRNSKAIFIGVRDARYMTRGVQVYGIAVGMNDLKVWRMQWIVSMCNDDGWYT